MKTNDARFNSAYLSSYLPLNCPTQFYISEKIIVLKETQIVIVESPWGLFACFHVTDTYTWVISEIHKQIVGFITSADV